MSFCSFSRGEIFKDHFDAGTYVCVKCGYELFSSKKKYEHSSPWPAFTETIHKDSVSKMEERPGALKHQQDCSDGALKATQHCVHKRGVVLVGQP
ncbi:methionine-R-sulfoxide reductase B1-A [Silurus meridionalis]|nr:methionine-R-sulfoxide reductase B1-A [Silurus meridionalis]